MDLPAESIKRLIAVGAIALCRFPPLDRLPGFKFRSKRLQRHGIGVSEFLTMENEEIGGLLGVPAALIARWRKDLEKGLHLPRRGPGIVRG
jgi:hypothetical protein